MAKRHRPDLARFQHPRFARMYVDAAEVADRRGGREHRERLLAGLSGRVIEIGAGNGRNFAHYPETVTEVVAVEPDDTLRRYAAAAARTAAVPVTVVPGHSEDLPGGDPTGSPADAGPATGGGRPGGEPTGGPAGGPPGTGPISAPDGAFDAAVVSLVLCTVPAPPRALAEIARVLEPGGELRFYEHVRSVNPVLGLLEDLITPAWRRLAGGCHPNRDTLAAITAAGFTVEHADRFGFSPQPLVPRTAHVLGTARSPADDRHRAARGDSG
jgi:SAM-dependent methyltransferase